MRVGQTATNEDVATLVDQHGVGQTVGVEIGQQRRRVDVGSDVLGGHEALTFAAGFERPEAKLDRHVICVVVGDGPIGHAVATDTQKPTNRIQ